MPLTDRIEVVLDDAACRALIQPGELSKLVSLFNARKSRKGEEPVTLDDLQLQGNLQIVFDHTIMPREVWPPRSLEETERRAAQLVRARDSAIDELFTCQQVALTHMPIGDIAPSSTWVTLAKEGQEVLLQDNAAKLMELAVKKLDGLDREVKSQREQLERAEALHQEKLAEKRRQQRLSAAADLAGLKYLPGCVAKKLAEACTLVIESDEVPDQFREKFIDALLAVYDEKTRWDNIREEVHKEDMWMERMPNGPRGYPFPPFMVPGRW